MPNSEDKKLNFVAKAFDPVTQDYRPIYIAPDGTDTVQGDVFLSDEIDETKTAAEGMTAITPAGVYNVIGKYFEKIDMMNPYRDTSVGSENLPIYIEEGTFKEITGIDAALITSGTISLDRLPQGAMERFVPVPNQEARFQLTPENVQLGDVVQQLDTGVMYVVVDEGNLGNEKGYTEFVAGTSVKAKEADRATFADVAEKIGTDTVGDTQTPVYIHDGVPEVVNKVKAAITADKLTAVDISNGTDLDTLTDSNKYYSCQFNGAASTLINCPTDKAFSLRVEYINTTNNCFVQILTTYTGQMWFRTHDGQAFVTNWMQIYPANASTAIGTLPVAHGGTGKTTLQEVANELWTATSIDEESDLDGTVYIWTGDNSEQSPIRRTLNKLWDWIQPKVVKTKVDNAGYADKADTANSATSAEKATHADTADSAKSADTAKKADTATSADTATKASTADVATKLGTETVGDSKTPVYLDNGTPKPVSSGGSVDEKTIFLAAHPVGSYWWTSSSTNPNTAYGGTWEQIKDRFVYAQGNSGTVGNTGGSSTVTLTTAQMPSHTHSGPSHSHTVNSHSHSLNSHTHSIGSHTHGLNSHTHSMTHTHTQSSHTHTITGTSGGSPMGMNFSKMANTVSTGLGGGSLWSGIKLGSFNFVLSSQTPTINNYTGSTGAASGSTASSSGTTGSSSGNTGSSSPSTDSASGTTGSAGSGNAHENMPPYITAYCWHRTA